MWLQFLVLSKQVWQSSVKLKLYTDAASTKGFGAVFQHKWTSGRWSVQENVHINLFELYPIVLALLLWGDLLQNSCVLFYSDNLAVVEILNKQSTKDVSMMILVHQFVLLCLKFNICFNLKHIPGIHNELADLLSRLQFAKAKQICPLLQEHQTPVPHRWTLSQLLQNS